MPTEQTLDVAALVAERAEILKWFAPAKAREMEIRRMLVDHFFPEIKEGTNRIEKDGYKVCAVHKVTRKIDEPALDAVMEKMPEAYKQLGVLIKYKPSLVMDGYNALDEETRRFFEQALEISEEGAPELKEIVSIEQPATTPIMDAYEKAKGAKVVGTAIADSTPNPDGTHSVEVKMPAGSQEAFENRPKPAKAKKSPATKTPKKGKK